MAQYTPNYGLHQWEASDSFLRTDFNEDHARIDAALGRTARSAEASAYNLYNLMLQSYYEGKYTGYRRGMLLSTFREPGSFTKSPELVLSGGCLSLYGQGQGDIDLGYGTGGGGSGSTPPTSPTGGVLWTGFICQIRNKASGTRNIAVTFQALVNGEERASVTLASGDLDSGASKVMRADWPEPIPLGERDVFAAYMRSSNSYTLFYPCPDNNDVGGILHLTPLIADTGWARTVEQEVPTAGEVQAWVRHAGGSVTLTLTDGDGTAHVLIPDRQRQTLDPEGNSCTESGFAGAGDFAAGEWTVKLDAARNSDEKMTVFDYGVIFR